LLISLHVKNLALIEETEVFFAPGLNILTGETGAGKSIIIGSVNLALGAKADKDIIRSGAEYALIELMFEIKLQEQLDIIRSYDIPIEEDGIVVLQRKVMPNRSMIKINGETVTAAILKKLAGMLLDIHGQHEHQTLLKAANHREILDSFGYEELNPLKNDLKQIFKEYTAINRELNKEENEESARKREQDLLEFEIREIESLNLVIGEDTLLEKEYQRMSNSGKIREAVVFAHGITGYDKDGSAGAEIGRALKEIMAVAAIDGEVNTLTEQLSDIDALINDFNRSAVDYLSALEFDEQKFIITENRLNQLNHIKNKYQTPIAGIIALKEEKKTRLADLSDYDNYRAKISEKAAVLKREIAEKCRQISAIRKKLSVGFKDNMIKALIDLNFPHIRFEAEISSADENISAEGYDNVIFMIAPNPGEALKPLNQIASGGELSRIMLALKTLKADVLDKGTLIFDEIDAGISGKTAWKVAERLAILGKGNQVICITHLPQIAAMADAHFAIKKEVIKERTTTSISKMTEEEIIYELARLLGTENITDAVLTNAGEMKELASKFKEK